MVIVVKTAIKKCFISAYRALKEKAGHLRIYIYSGNNSIKARYLIGI